MSARKTTSQPSRAKLDAACAKVRRLFGHRPNFTGADVGYQWEAGKRTDRLTVRVHVSRKLPVAEIDSAAVFPTEIDGLPLDVIERKYRVRPEMATRPAHFRGRLPQLMGGISCGRADGSTGTAGLVVLDRRTGRPGLLSNWHVLAGPRARVGDPVLHPGLVDAPSRAAEVARLERWMLDADGDAAVALLAPDQGWLPLQVGTFLPTLGTRGLRLGETLVKSGRTTSVTEAQVDGEGTYNIGYETHPGPYESREIRGFVLVPTAESAGNAEISQGGDSGSAWVSRSDDKAVGLHIAGETDPDPSAEYAIACCMETVLDRLDLEVAGFEAWMAWVNKAETMRAEYTPHPDGPDFPYPGWPWWPPRPLPFPAPWPGSGGGPEPLPWPWLDRWLDAGGWHGGLPAATERALSPARAMWRRLKRALAARGLGWPDLSIGAPVPIIANGSPNVHATIARITAETPDLPTVTLGQIEHCATFRSICLVLVEIEEAGQ